MPFLWVLERGIVPIKLWLSMDLRDLDAFPIRSWMARGALLLLLLPLFGATCSDGSTRQASTSAEEARSAAPETASNAVNGEGTGDAVEREPEDARIEGTGDEAVVPVGDSTPTQELDSTSGQPQPPLDIFAVMLGAGYAAETEQDLADYLPIPPRAEGQVGRFLIDTDVVTVVRVTYPEEVFAGPHESWIHERMALQPDAHERVVRQGATVVHIRADSARRADEVHDLFLGVSGSETQTPETQTPETQTDDGP